MKKVREYWIGMALALGATACSGGGGGGSSFDLVFGPDNGTGFGGAEVSNLNLVPAQQVDFTLPAGLSVTGQVTDSTGAPMTGVDVLFQTSANAPKLDEDTTDAMGNYSVTLPEGSLLATLDSGLDAVGTMRVTDVDIVGPGAVVVDFQFPQLVSASGLVTEEFGPVIPNAELQFVGQESGADLTVTADATGLYMTNLVPDTYDITVKPKGAAEATHLEELFPSVVVGPSFSRNFTLTAGTTISGTVLDDAGQPFLGQVDIDIVLPANSPYKAADGVTSSAADGSFSFGLVPPGSVTLRLEADDDSGFPRQDLTFKVPASGTQMTDLMMRKGYVVMGTIFQSDGVTPEDNTKVQPTPIKNVLEPDKDKSDATGAYVVSVFGGTYDFVLTPDDQNSLHLPESVRIVVTSDMTVDFTLTLGARVMGNVTQPGGLVGEQDIRVEIEGVTGASDVTDGNGDYSFVAPIGTHTLKLTAEKGNYEDIALDSVSGVVVSAPGPITRDIEMVLATTGTRVVTGTVLEPDGVTPAVGTEVTALDANGIVLGRTYTVAGGAYILVMP